MSQHPHDISHVHPHEISHVHPHDVSRVHPHDVSQLLEPAMTEMVHAIADRAGRTEAEYDAKAAATWTLIESFQPRDIVDVMLSGQLVALNEVFADATRDLLRGMVDTLKQRTQSGLISMCRMTQGHIDRLAKRGNQPYQTEVATPLPAPRPAVATVPPVVQPVVETPEPPLPAEPPAMPAPILVEPEETSWIDEPYQEYVIETPGLLIAREKARRISAVFALADAMLPGNDPSASPRREPEPAAPLAPPVAAAGD